MILIKISRIWVIILTVSTKILIAGDFNVPLIDFGYSRQTDRTEVFLEHIMDKDLKIMNDATAPHSFVQGSLKGRPDLTLGGLEICNKLNNWYVDDKTFSFSDHRYIRFSLGYSPKINTKIRYKTKNKKFSKDVKSSEMNWLRSLLSVKTPQELNTHVESFMNQVTAFADKHFRKGSLSYTPTIKWFNNNIRIERNKVAVLYKRHIRNPDNQNMRDEYIQARNRYKKIVKKANRDSWSTFCYNTSETYGTLYKYITGKTSKPSDFIFTRLENSQEFDAYDDVAQDLMKEHFNVDQL